MKNQLSFAALWIFAFSFCAMASFTEDAWDPADNHIQTATPLPDPGITDQSHGPHTLSATDTVDWFQLDLEQGVVYEFFATGESDTSAELFAAGSDIPTAMDEDNGPLINFLIRFQPVESGTFFLKVQLYDATRKGAYFLHYLVRSGKVAEPDPWDPADDSSLGATRLLLPLTDPTDHGPHTLSQDDLEDWFSVVLQAGETYEFGSISHDDVAIELYGRQGTQRIAVDDDSGKDRNFLLRFTPQAEDTYFLRVFMFEKGFNGSYQLTYRSGAEPVPAGDPWDPTDDIFEGGTVLGTPALTEQAHGPHTLSRTDSLDWYRFQLQAGIRYRFASTGASNTIAELYGADGKTFLGEDDNSGEGNNFEIVFTPGVTAEYLLQVRSFQNQEAQYQLLYQQLDQATPPLADEWDPEDDTFAAATRLGVPSQDVQTHGPHFLSNTDREDWFAFDVTAGMEYEFWTSGSADTVGELFMPDGTTGITQQDDGGSAFNFRIRVQASTGNTYFLRVRMFDQGSRGSYTLHYSQAISDTGSSDGWDPSDDLNTNATRLEPITPTEIQHGPHLLSSSDRNDWFSFSLAVGTDYEFFSTGNSDTVATLYYPDGSTVVLEQDDGGTGNNFRIRFSPSLAGLYFMNVREFAGGDALYFFHARGVPKPPLDVTPARIFEFQSDFDFTPVPGGFSHQAAGHVSLSDSIGNQDSTLDGKGAVLSTSPGEVILLQLPTLQSDGQVVLLRALVQSDAPGAAVALAALDGSFDGSIATNIPSDSQVFQGEFQWMTLVYQPASGSFAPMVQLANLNGSEEVNLTLDRLEAYLIPDNKSVSSHLFLSQTISNPASPLPAIPDITFSLLSDTEFSEQAGGFEDAPAGRITTGAIPPSTDYSDGLGTTLTTASKEVEMMLFPSLEIGEDLVLLRARIRSSEGGGSIALAGLDGSLDGSIATHISMNSGLYSNAYRWINLIYDPASDSITPLLQLAGIEEGKDVSLYIDTLEVYSFSPDEWIPTRLFYEK